MSTPGKVEFEPYAQLVSAMLPRAAGITVFDSNGDVRWTSEESVHLQLPDLARGSAVTASLKDEPGELAHLSEDEPVYFFWLRDDADALLSIVAISWRSGEAEQRPFAYVHAMAKSVLECLRREMALRASLLQAGDAPGGRDHDLDVLLGTSESARPDGVSDEIPRVLQNVTNHMRCDYTALLVPERNVIVVSKAEGRAVDTSLLAKLHRHLLSLAQVRGEPVILNASGALPGVSLTCRVLSAPLRNPAGRASGILVLFRSYRQAEFRERDAQLVELVARRAASLIEASYDPLSGLLMRDAFEQRVRALLEQRGSGTRQHWSSLYIDMDRMHVINDNYGMHVGDRLLAKMGELIRSRLVPGALAARISGDRFAILLPTAPDDAVNFAEALRLGVEALQPAQLGATTESNVNPSISVGVASVSDPQVDSANSFGISETACKAAKDRGRNRVELYQASDMSIMRRHEDVNIVPGLRAAISENRLRLDSQLIVPLNAKGAVPHFELLLRMIGDDGGVIGPDRFLSAAVRYQLMPEVDRWVIREALRLLTPHAALLANRAVVFTINVSGQSVGDPDFAEFVIEQIKNSRINPEVFCFELTESATIANLARAEGMMIRLRSLGCSIALDDFGTGLSSLAYLRALPVDMLKIDGSFVRDILKDPRAESMVQAIAQLASAMELETVAEYVETDEIRLRLMRLKVDYGQGFAIARPVPLTQTIEQLPVYATATDMPQHEEIVLSSEEDTISTELEEKIFGDMNRIEDTQRRIERILEGYDHGESTLYQRKSGA